MMASSLREKFKLLRQWQIQQQEEFLQKTLLQGEKSRREIQNSLNKEQRQGIRSFSDLERSVSNNSLNESDGYQQSFMEEAVKPDQRLMERMSPGSLETALRFDDPSLQRGLLQRMTSNSLEHALSLAMNELQSQDASDDALGGSEKEYGNDDVENTEEYNNEDKENEANEMEGDELETNSWNTSGKLQTVIFKPKYQLANLEDSSETGSLHDMDGFCPIVYSEDNLSHEGTDDENEQENEEINMEMTSRFDKVLVDVPFDEKPIASSLGAEPIPFEALIERQLQTEKQNAQHAETERLAKIGPSKRKFLKKGQGTARFKVNLRDVAKAKQKSRKSARNENNTKFLPKTSLKLIPDPKIANAKGKEQLAKIQESSYSSKQPTGGENNCKTNYVNPDPRKQPFGDFNTSSRINFRPEPRASKTADSSMEASFQQMINDKEDDEKVDEEELAEFELLEQVALDTSLSSNASSVFRMLAKAKPLLAQNFTSSPIGKAIQEDKQATYNDPYEMQENNEPETAQSEEEFEVEIPRKATVKDKVNNIVASPVENEFISDENFRNQDLKRDQFLDNTAWGDTTHSSDTTEDGNSTITESPMIKQRAVTQAKKPSPVRYDSPPPTSDLMKKFFPSLRNDQATKQQPNSFKKTRNLLNSSNTQQTKTVSPSHGQENMPPQMQSDVLKSKLAELEAEISKFKHENSELEKLRIDRERELKSFHIEVDQFQKQRADELERIEKFRNEEVQKIKREKKIFEKYQKATRSAPNKKERDDIESLKQHIAEQQDELKRRETRWNGSAARFRKRIEELENENYELKENLKLLEKERIQKWAKAEQDPARKSKVKKFQAVHVNEDASFDLQREIPAISQTTNQEKLDQPNVQRKTKTIMKHNLSPQNGGQESNISRRTEVNPRTGILPQQLLSLPSDNTGGLQVQTDSGNSPSSRLSLTPEKQDITNGKRDQSDPEMKYQDGKVERILSDGSREITFPNGTRKTIDPTNQNVVVSFFNGDMKQLLPDGRIVYYYAESKTTHTTYKDGTEIFEFSTGQTEKHFPDGRKVITFQDETVKCIFVNGAEETVFADGTVQNVDVNGDRTISFPNGQREIHTKHFKRREYPDGTMKTVYQDGRQETRYSTGRLRVKDQSGTVILDTGIS